MTTITRSIKLDARDAAEAFKDWIEKHHPEQELDRKAVTRIDEVRRGWGPSTELGYIVEWTVTKPAPEKEP